MKGRADVFFATSNKGKFKEAQLVLKSYGIRLRRLSEPKHEIQSDSLEQIATEAAGSLANEKRLSVLVEDSGLFVSALDGFPGPYSSYVYQTVGFNGILKLLENEADRTAEFRTAAAYCRPNAFPKSFVGAVRGIIVKSPRGNRGFGFDPIFAPAGDHSRTFGEMTTEEKNHFSHRAQALQGFAEWFVSSK